MAAGAGVIDEVLASDLVDDPRRHGAAEPSRARATARRRRRWGKQAVLAAATGASIGGFLALAHVAGGKRESAFDRRLVKALGRARHPFTNAVVQGVTFLGSVGGAVVVSGAAVIASRRHPRLAAQVVLGTLGGAIAELLMKRFFGRKRPTLLGHLESVSSSSFPSGHSMAAASLYLTLAFVGSRSRRLRERRSLMLTSAGVVAASIATSRVFLGVHWPTDVLGGLTLGTAWACATEAAFDYAAATKADREADIAQPGLFEPSRVSSP